MVTRVTLPQDKRELLEAAEAKVNDAAKDVDEKYSKLAGLEAMTKTQQRGLGADANFKDKKAKMLKRYQKFDKYAKNLRDNGLEKMHKTSDGLEALIALMEYLVGLMLGKMISEIKSAGDMKTLNGITPGSKMREAVSDTLGEMLNTDKLGDKAKPMMDLVKQVAMAPASLLGGAMDKIGDGVQAAVQNQNASQKSFDKITQGATDSYTKAKTHHQTLKEELAKIRDDMHLDPEDTPSDPSP